MTKAPTPAEMSKGQSDNTKTPQKSVTKKKKPRHKNAINCKFAYVDSRIALLQQTPLEI